MICYCLLSVFARENKTFQLEGMTQLYTVFLYRDITVEYIKEDKKRERKISYYQDLLHIYIYCVINNFDLKRSYLLSKNIE
jgi:hypothetical protein